MIVIGLILIALALWAYGTQVIGSYCQNGELSDSTGSGTCAYNDGVDKTRGEEGKRVVDTVLGLRPFSWIGVTKWPALLVGAVGAITGLMGLGATSALALVPNKRKSKAPTDPAPTTDLGVFAGDYLELLVKIDERPHGFAVEVTTPMNYSRRVLRNEPLPRDRGAQELIALSAQASKWGRSKKETKAAEAFGTKLFHAVFSKAGEQAFRDSIDFARRHNAVLRIVLQIDEAFADNPWEYLYDPDRGAFLSLSKETSLVRLLPANDDTRTQDAISTLRILSMAASPRRTAKLDVEAEHAQIRAALQPSIAAEQVELQFVDGGTFDALRTALREFQPHVFHFAGHGDWNVDLDDGAILFEDSASFPDPRTGVDLGVLLNQPSLRLAVFNSCDGAVASKDNRFAGITSSLVAQGVPAAIGMQFAFDDKAAITFSSSLLQELAAGAPLDQAVTDARIAVFSQKTSIEWGTPVLTTRIDLDQVLPRAQSGKTNARS